MCMNLFSFNDKDDISKSLGIIDYFSHICYEAINGFIVYLIFFQFSNVQNANVVQPFAPVKSPKYEQLLSSNNTSCVSLSACRCFFAFHWVTPPHSIRIEYVQVIGWDDFLE